MDLTGIDWSGVMAAVATIATAYIAYRQKKEEREAKKREVATTEKIEHKFGTKAKIIGRLWEALHELSADRVYIVQPHPLTKKMYLSITMEVVRDGIAIMKDEVQDLRIEEVAVFAKDLATREFVMYNNIEEEVRDVKARAILAHNGTHSAIIRRLLDEQGEWVGNIICEYTRTSMLDKVNAVFAKETLTHIADNVQYILPDVE